MKSAVMRSSSEVALTLAVHNGIHQFAANSQILPSGIHPDGAKAGNHGAFVHAVPGTCGMWGIRAGSCRQGVK
jgi:hypothetical protein